MAYNATSIFSRLLLALLFAGLLVLGAAPGVGYAAKTIAIAAARALPLGSTATVKGTVTVPSGVFASGTFDQGFAIQDKSGGIYVSVQSNLDLQPRDQVEVTGQLDDVFGVLNLVAAKKSQGGTLGKPKGTLLASKFDHHRSAILDLLAKGLSIRKIAKYLGYTDPRGLNTYVNKRGLRQIA